MHELSITQSVVDAVCERADGRPVHSVKVQVGALTAVVPEAMRFCFELVVAGTVAHVVILLDRFQDCHGFPPVTRPFRVRGPRGGITRGAG